MGFGKDGKGQVLWDTGTATLSTISSKTLEFLNAAYDEALTHDFRQIKMEYNFSILNGTVDQGPLVVGMVPSGTDATTLEAILEATITGPDEIVELAESNGIPVWIFGLLYTTTEGVGQTHLSGEKTIRWTFHDQGGWDYFVYNLQTSTYATGSVFQFFNKIFGVWVK